MPKEVFPTDVKQVVEMTGCSAERARRELEQHSLEAAINVILDEPNHDTKVQKLSHPPSAPSSSPARGGSAFTSVATTPAKSSVNQGTMVQVTPSAPKGTFAAIPNTPTGNVNPQAAEMTEEEQLNYALAASMETVAQAPVSDNVTSISAQDNDMQLAIEASLRNAGSNGQGNSEPMGFDDPNPHTRQRASLTVPAGLRNVGNTCYVNSILQTYFHVPCFLQILFSLFGDDSVAAAAAAAAAAVHSAGTTSHQVTVNGIPFTQELRKVFALMLCSSKLYVDPSPALSALTTIDGGHVKLGQQEDATQFNLTLLRHLESSFIAWKTADASFSHAADAFRQLFTGQIRQVLCGVESMQPDLEGPIIITLADRDSVLEGLDDYCNQEVKISAASAALAGAGAGAAAADDGEPSTPSIRTQNTYTFDRFPAVLGLHLNRMGFDVNRGQFKIDRPFHFEKRISVDRFSTLKRDAAQQQRQQWLQRRSYRLALQAKRALLSDPLHPDLEGSALCNRAASVVKMMQEMIPSVNGDDALAAQRVFEMQQTISVLQQCANHCSTVLPELDRQIAAAQLEEDECWAGEEFNEIRYRLLSVLVHEGSHLSGHYFSYMCNFAQNDKWYRLSDINVTEVDEATVFEKSRGSLKANSSSAYCLFYLREDMCRESITDVQLPPDLAAFVAEANGRFQAEIAAWDVSHAGNCAVPAAPATASQEVKDTLVLARDREAAILSEVASKGLSRFEHSLLSLAAFAHNSNRRPLFLGIVSDSAVCDSFKRPYAQLTEAVQNELKNAALEVVVYICDLSVEQGASLKCLRNEFSQARRFAQCLIVVHDSVTRPDASGTMAHLQNVQVALGIAFFVIDTASPSLKAILDTSPLLLLSRFVVESLLRAWNFERERGNAVTLLAIANVALQIGSICLNKHLRAAADANKASDYRSMLRAAYESIYGGLSVLYSQFLSEDLNAAMQNFRKQIMFIDDGHEYAVEPPIVNECNGLDDASVALNESAMGTERGDRIVKQLQEMMRMMATNNTVAG